MKGQNLLLVLILMFIYQAVIGQNRVAGPDKLHCSGNPAVMLTPDSGYLSYTWSPATFLSDSTVQNPLASPGSTITYTLTVFDGVSYFTDEVTVYAPNVPVGTTDDIIENNDTTVCYNTVVQLTTQFSDNVSWFDNFTNISSSNDTFTFSVEANHMVNLSVTDAYGCTLTEDVRILGIGPALDVNVVGASCSDGTGDVEVIETNGINAPFTIAWNDGDTTFARDSIAMGVYSFTVMDNIGCTSSGNVIIGGSTKKIDLSVSGGGLCNGDTAQINARGNGTSIFTYDPQVYTVGTGSSYSTSTTAYPAIFGNYFRSARHQMLFRASELSAAGMTAGVISSLSFDVAQIAGNTNYCNFQVKMRYTNLTELSDTMKPNGTVVLDPSTVFVQAGWNDLSFNTPFYWDGVSNLIVDVCFDKTSITNSGDPFCDEPYTRNSSNRYTTTPYFSVISSKSDVTPQCDLNIVGTRSNDRPNIRFRRADLNDSIVVAQVNWSSATGLSDSTILEPFVYPDTTTTYIITLSDTSGCIYRDSVIVKVSDIAAQPSAVQSLVPCGVKEVDLLANATSRYPITSYNWTGLDNLTPSFGSASTTGELALDEDSALVSLTTTDQLGCAHFSSVVVEREPNCAIVVTGFIFEDRDSNCLFRNADVPLEGVLVNVLSDQDIYTDANGQYTFTSYDTGVVRVEVTIPNGYHNPCSISLVTYPSVPSFGTAVQLNDIPFTRDTVIVNGVNDHIVTELQLFPNPANEVLNVSTTMPVRSMEVIDLTGRMVYSEEVHDSNIELTTSSFAIGSYILVITDEMGASYSRKFSVLR